MPLRQRPAGITQHVLPLPGRCATTVGPRSGTIRRIDRYTRHHAFAQRLNGQRLYEGARS